MSDPDFLNLLGPLAPFYQDDDIIEIAADAYDRIYVWGRETGSWQDTEAKFESPESYRQTIDGLFNLKGIDLEGKASAEVSLPDGARVIAVLPPAALGGPNLVIRKLFRYNLDLPSILKYNSLTQEILDTFESAILARQNILLAGGTQSGKTTLANNIASLIPEDQRVIVVEDPHEMNIRHPRKIYLEGGSTSRISKAEMIDTAARMVPDWLLVSDLQGVETLRALQVFNQGYAGMATMHADTVEDALTRLETMCLMANLGVGLPEIRHLIASSIQLIAVANRLKHPDGKLVRRVTQMSELHGLENNRYLLQPLFRYLVETQEFEATGVKPSWQE